MRIDIAKTALRKGTGVLGIFLAVSFALWSPSAQAAQEDGTITVSVVERATGDNGQAKNPVAGVKIHVQGAAGSADGVTDAKGLAVLNVPQTGKYDVSFDVTSLPKGVAVNSDTKTTASIDFSAGVSVGTGKSLSFFVGTDTRTTKGRWGLLPKTLVNGIKLSLILAICSIGLALIYGTTGLTNFAHSEIITMAAMVTFWFNQNGPRWPLLLAAPFGVAASALMGSAFELRVWRPLRHRPRRLRCAALNRPPCRRVVSATASVLPARRVPPISCRRSLPLALRRRC